MMYPMTVDDPRYNDLFALLDCVCSPMVAGIFGLRMLCAEGRFDVEKRRFIADNPCESLACRHGDRKLARIRAETLKQSVSGVGFKLSAGRSS